VPKAEEAECEARVPRATRCAHAGAAAHTTPRRSKNTGAHTRATGMTARTRVMCSHCLGARHLDKDFCGARCTGGLIPTPWPAAAHLEQPRARQQGAAEQPRAVPKDGRARTTKPRSGHASGNGHGHGHWPDTHAHTHAYPGTDTDTDTARHPGRLSTDRHHTTPRLTPTSHGTTMDDAPSIRHREKSPAQPHHRGARGHALGCR